MTRRATLILSPLGVRLVEGLRDWKTDMMGAEHLPESLTDLLTGFEMGFAAATRDPWDGRCSLEPLPFEVDA